MESVNYNQEQLEEKKFSTWLYRLAGYSGIAIAVSYVFITAGFVTSGVPLPKGGEAWVTYMAGKSGIWWGIIWLSIITDILYLPVAAGLYRLLKNVHKGLLLTAGALYALFVVLELSITYANFPVIVESVNGYGLATSEAQKALYLSTIEYASHVFQTPVAPFYTIFIPSAAVILFSVVMLKSGKFNKSIAYIGMLSGTLNALSVVGGWFSSNIGQVVVVGSVLALVWKFAVGIKFLKFARGSN